ncbi:MAG: hypothetical protein ABJH07_23015 [Sedimentitalea sp.]|uniref:hypothetical protein n=1 Tax=Sedimentitalea sp. TaxID=2048915 RepID=UPI003264923A
MKDQKDTPMHARSLPDHIADLETLEDLLSRPDAATEADLAALDGEIMVLGVSGKVGPSLAHMAARAAPNKRVVGVARFSDPDARAQLDEWGVETI